MTPRPPSSTLFPYTTLFRSKGDGMRQYPSSSSARRCAAGARSSSARRVETAARPGAPSSSAAEGRFAAHGSARSEEHTSELQSRQYLVCRLLLEKKKI